MEQVTTRMTRTTDPCWRCGKPLYRLDPPVHGWGYHCQECQHLTQPREALMAALAGREEGAVGIVSAVSCRIEVQQVG